MRRTARVFLVATALLLAGAAAAWADTCYESEVNGLLLVLKNFTPPGTPNACANINGYLAFTPCPLSGNACRGADSDVIIFQAESSLFACLFEVGWFIDPVTQEGLLAICDDAVFCPPNDTVRKVVCPTIRPFGIPG